jgi:hypothetical protein
MQVGHAVFKLHVPSPPVDRFVLPIVKLIFAI